MVHVTFDQFLEDPQFFPDWSTIPSRNGSITAVMTNSGSAQISSSVKPTYYSESSDPVWLIFVYGTLSVPHLLKRLLQLEETPILDPANIGGYIVKMWGPYPALVSVEGDDDEKAKRQAPVKGKVFRASEKEVHLLAQYEGENYSLSRVTIHMGGSSCDGCAFIWSGYPAELEDGEFDPNHFAKS